MPNNNLKWIFLGLLSLIWGSSFILIKKGLIGLTAIQVGSMRVVFAGLFLILIGFRTLKNIPKNKWKYVALTSFLGTFFPAFLFAMAQKHISSTVSSILNSITPLNTLILGALIFGLTFKRMQIIGVFTGLIGCVILIMSGAANHPEQNYWYVILVVIASICYALNVNLIKKHLSNISPLSISTGNFAITLLPSLIILFSTGFFSQIHEVDIQHSAFFIMILGIIGTGIANLLFFKLIQISSPVFATSVTYLIPIVAFFWGIFDQESLSLVQIFGAFIILIGVYLSAKK
jgi:drug/metabolite transporter (DMT)-like permease